MTNSPDILRDKDSGDWRHDAACRDEDPELFFPPTGDSHPARLQTEEAKAFCKKCPVIDECLTFSIDNSQEAGVWGGLSEKERQRMKRKNIRLRMPRGAIAS